jgi:hypothetical protein
VHFSRQNPDGTISAETNDPPPCERCDEVPEEVMEIVEVIVDTREDLQCFRFQAGNPACVTVRSPQS